MRRPETPADTHPHLLQDYYPEEEGYYAPKYDTYGDSKEYYGGACGALGAVSASARLSGAVLLRHWDLRGAGPV
jgi:hypothetical protein